MDIPFITVVNGKISSGAGEVDPTKCAEQFELRPKLRPFLDVKSLIETADSVGMIFYPKLVPTHGAAPETVPLLTIRPQ